MAVVILNEVPGHCMEVMEVYERCGSRLLVRASIPEEAVFYGRSRGVPWPAGSSEIRPLKDARIPWIKPRRPLTVAVVLP